MLRLPFIASLHSLMLFELLSAASILLMYTEFVRPLTFTFTPAKSLPLVLSFSPVMTLSAAYMPFSMSFDILS